MRSPLQLVGAQLPEPSRAATLGEHSDEVLREVLGYTAEQIRALRDDEVVG